MLYDFSCSEIMAGAAVIWRWTGVAIQDGSLTWLMVIGWELCWVVNLSIPIWPFQSGGLRIVRSVVQCSKYEYPSRKRHKVQHFFWPSLSNHIASPYFLLLVSSKSQVTWQLELRSIEPDSFSQFGLGAFTSKDSWHLLIMLLSC